MQVVLAHADHSHGSDPALVALVLIASVVLGVLAAGTALRRARSGRQKHRVGGDEGM
jgi:hypothetical protein